LGNFAVPIMTCSIPSVIVTHTVCIDQLHISLNLYRLYLGFDVQLKVCSPSPSMPFNSLLFNRCEASLEKAASLTMPYKIGFIQGKNDSLTSLHDYVDACKAFPGFVREGTPNWECYLGYADGLSAPANHAAQQIAIAANKATLAYKTGFRIGRANGKISICDEFSGRSGDICSKAYHDGVRSIR
jgi:hypothetical protein